MLDAAVDEGLILSNPARTPSGKVGYLPSPKRHKAHRYLSHAELEALASASGDHGTMIRLAGLTGLRWGEITALRVGDVDPLRRKVTVSRAYSIVGGRKILGNTKTHERRTITFPASLTVALVKSAEGKGPNDLLFGTGEPVDHSNFAKRVLDKAWKAAGIERLTFHDLRHTAASLAVQAGGNVKAVQRMLGHASATMTLDTYAGLFDTDAQALADRMDEARERAISESSAHYLPTGPQNVIPLASGS
jgi:integrase